MENILEIEQFSKSFKDFSISDLSFSLKKGYIMGFIGPNGSGKTTTIQTIMNLIRKDSGSIKVFGLDHVEQEKNIKNRIGFVYDESPYFQNITIEENERIIAPFYNNWDHTCFINLLKKFDLDPKKKLSGLSKGMKTKVSLAMALSHRAELIILDEPTAGLDPVFRREILDVFYDVIQDGEKSILFSTHITSDLDKIADYITFIDHGKLVLSEPMDQIKDQFKIIKGGNDILEKLPKDVLIGTRQTKYGFEALTNDKELISRIVKDAVIIEQAVLEDIMVFYHNNKR